MILVWSLGVNLQSGLRKTTKGERITLRLELLGQSSFFQQKETSSYCAVLAEIL